jgi:hypothetical protein
MCAVKATERSRRKEDVILKKFLIKPQCLFKKAVFVQYILTAMTNANKAVAIPLDWSCHKGFSLDLGSREMDTCMYC